jgi:hypothetical protein
MQIFDKPSPGQKAATLLTGVGLGAALMYLLDPERGKRRRALARDKAVSLANQTGRAVARRSRDLGNRAKGVAAEIRSAAGRSRDEGEAGSKGDAGNGNAAQAERERTSPPQPQGGI